ncbi:unnamed protein product [Symbiodinium microadriaticum]|nr:unnamed protein product [Symbiodinium microadriaticum]
MLAFISFFSGVYYTYKACHSAEQPRHMGAGSFFAGQKEHRQGAHMLLWTLLAPQQWVMHARLYTKSSALESAQLLLTTAFVMIFGMAAVQTDMSREGGWIGPHWEVRFWFTLSFLHLLAVLKRAYQLPMEPVTAKAGMFYLKVKFFFWLSYPAIYILRSFGFVSAWQEEVLLLTFLDLITKCLSLTLGSVAPETPGFGTFSLPRKMRLWYHIKLVSHAGFQTERLDPKLHQLQAEPCLSTYIYIYTHTIDKHKQTNTHTHTCSPRGTCIAVYLLLCMYAGCFKIVWTGSLASSLDYASS